MSTKEFELYHGYIYLTTNLVNNKKYIGLHRGQYDPSYLGSGIALKSSIKLHGKDNFTNKVIEYCENESTLVSKEIELIQYYNAVESKNFYNISHGGDGFLSGNKNPMYKNGKPLSKSHKMKISVANAGKRRTKAQKKIQSLQRLGEGNPFFNLKHSAETRSKMSKSSLGKKKGKQTNPHPNVKCPYCGKVGNKGALTRWHFDNCKHKY